MSTKAILREVKVKICSPKVTIKEKSQTCGATQVSCVILHVGETGEKWAIIRESTLKIRLKNGSFSFV